MPSYQDKTRIRLRYAVLLSLALHILLLFSVGIAPPSLPGNGNSPDSLNVTLEKNPDEQAHPATNTEVREEQAARAPSVAAATPSRPPAARPEPPEPSAGSSEAAAPREILAIDKPATEQEAARAPAPPASEPQKIAETPPAAAPPDKQAAPPAQEPPAAQPEKILPPPAEPERPVQPMPPPVKTEPPVPPQVETPPPPPVRAPEQPRPAETEPVVASKPAPAQTGKAAEIRQKPAGYDLSGLAGLDMSSIKRPPENSGPKIRFGERRKVIGLREQDLTYQLYAESVRMKLERVGRFNYPIEAARQGISGTLVVLVSIRADGSLEDFSITRPSYDVLNAAADRVVHMSSPFSPLPPRILQDTDILTIQITWTFSSSRQAFE